MSTNRGIFESFPNQPQSPGNRADSPFAVVHDAPLSAHAAHAAIAASPFAPVARQESPFTVIEDAQENRPSEPGRPARVPERRKVESPFQVADPMEGFGFEAAPANRAAAPAESAPTPTPSSSPFSVAPQTTAPSPFAADPPLAPSLSTQAALAAFQNWPDAAAPAPAPPVAIPQAFAQPAPAAVAAAPAPAPAAAAPAQPAFAPTPLATAPVFDESQSDSFSIRQLELRAVFGVDREMTHDEILQRSRALPGMRNLARVSSQEMTTVEALKQLLPNLGFGSGALKLYSGSVPLEFIREGSVMLAVQTDGGFAPGVRETLMLVARELGRN